jgi:hypothetical protein
MLLTMGRAKKRRMTRMVKRRRRRRAKKKRRDAKLDEKMCVYD